MSCVFADYGDHHVVTDENGEPTKTIAVELIQRRKRKIKSKKKKNSENTLATQRGLDENTPGAKREEDQEEKEEEEEEEVEILEAVITTSKEHGLDEEDKVTFEGVRGMTELNGGKKKKTKTRKKRTLPSATEEITKQ